MREAAKGHFRTSTRPGTRSALPPSTDIVSVLRHVRSVEISAAGHTSSSLGRHIRESCPLVAQIVPCDVWRGEWCRRRLIDLGDRDLILRHKHEQAFQPGHGMASRSATAQSNVTMLRWGSSTLLTLAAMAQLAALPAAAAQRARPASPVDADGHGSFGQSCFPKTLNHQLRTF